MQRGNRSRLQIKNMVYTDLLNIMFQHFHTPATNLLRIGTPTPLDKRNILY